jgi:hypothetical protein
MDSLSHAITTIATISLSLSLPFASRSLIRAARPPAIGFTEVLTTDAARALVDLPEVS